MKFVYLMLSFFLLGCEKKNENWKKLETYEYVLNQSKRKINLLNKRLVPDFRFKENNEIAKGYFYNSKNSTLSNEKWEISLPIANKIHVFECGPYVVCGDLSTTFHVLKKNNGKILYKGDLKGPLGFAFYSNGRLVICNTTGDIKCFNSGFDLMWHKKKSSFIGLNHYALLVGENIISLTSDGDILSTNIINGEEVWSQVTSQKVDSHDLYANGNMILSRINHYLFIFNQNGKVLYSKYIDNLKKALFDGERFIYLVFNNKVLVTDLQGIVRNEFYRVYNSKDSLFFMFRKSLFSFSQDRNLNVYHNKKEGVLNFNGVFDSIDYENCVIGKTDGVYFI